MGAEAQLFHTTCPHDCPSSCALVVERLPGNRLGRVRGADEHSYTAGVICSKVARYAERIHHPDRLLHPLKRTGPKGSRQFAQISWDEALDEVATRLLDAELGVVIGALALGIAANLYARVLDRPQQVVLVPAMILLVPGSMGFRGMSSLLDRNTMNGIETTFATFVVALAIAAGLLIASAVVSPRRAL